MLKSLAHTSRLPTRLEPLTGEMPHPRTPEKRLGGLRCRTAYGWRWDHAALVILTLCLLITGVLLIIVLAGLMPMFSFVLNLPTILALLTLLRLLWYEPH